MIVTSGEQLMELDLHVALAEIAEEEKTSKISDEMLSYVANLARLNIEDDEKEELTKNLEDIIAFADRLNDVKIHDVDPLAYIIDNNNSNAKLQILLTKIAIYCN